MEMKFLLKFKFLSKDMHVTGSNRIKIQIPDFLAGKKDFGSSVHKPCKITWSELD